MTTKSITFLVGNPYKPLFTTVTGRGPHPGNSSHTSADWVIFQLQTEWFFFHSKERPLFDAYFNVKCFPWNSQGPYNPKGPKINQCVGTVSHLLFSITVIFCPCTPKTHGQMKVLHPKIWGITPKNEGFGFPWWGVFGLDPPGQGRENRKHSFAGCCPERTARRLAMLTSSNFQTFKWYGKLTRLYPRNLTNWCPNNESPYLYKRRSPPFFQSPIILVFFQPVWFSRVKNPWIRVLIWSQGFSCISNPFSNPSKITGVVAARWINSFK